MFQLKHGDLVRVLDDAGIVRRLQDAGHGGWNDKMSPVCFESTTLDTY